MNRAIRSSVVVALCSMFACQAGEATEAGDAESGTSSASGSESATETGTETGTETETDGGELMGELICGLGSTSIAGWTRHTIANDIPGAAYTSIADFDGDGKQDIVSSALGDLTIAGIDVSLSPGEVHVHLQRDTLDCWERIELVGPSDDIYFPNETTVGDVDGDGDLDIVLAAGFFVCSFDPDVTACGGLYVFENVGDHFERRDLYHAQTRFFHKAQLLDVDGDGALDLVTSRESNADGQTLWLAGDGAGNFDTDAPRIIDDIGGSFPVIEDIDDDGDLDVAMARFFEQSPEAPGYVWFERTGEPSDAAPAGTWARHVLSPDHGPGIMLRLTRDLYGDGILRAVATNHVNQGNEPPDVWESAVIVFEPGADPTTPWTGTIVSTGIVSLPDAGLAIRDAPGVFDLGDADQDGDLDVFVAGDGDPRTFWLEQIAPGDFTTHVIENALGQAGGGHAVDLDGDGDSDPVFTGYENDLIYVYEG